MAIVLLVSAAMTIVDLSRSPVGAWLEALTPADILASVCLTVTVRGAIAGAIAHLLAGP